MTFTHQTNTWFLITPILSYYFFKSCHKNVKIYFSKIQSKIKNAGIFFLCVTIFFKGNLKWCSCKKYSFKNVSLQISFMLGKGFFIKKMIHFRQKKKKKIPEGENLANNSLNIHFLLGFTFFVNFFKAHFIYFTLSSSDL